MIVKTTPHAKAAKAFVDFILSDEGQQMVANRYILPSRTDIKAKRAGWDDLNIIGFDAVKAADEAPAIKSKFAKLVK
jgi:iron(III) transport system substrate-binding protein